MATPQNAPELSPAALAEASNAQLAKIIKEAKVTEQIAGAARNIPDANPANDVEQAKALSAALTGFKDSYNGLGSYFSWVFSGFDSKPSQEKALKEAEAAAKLSWKEATHHEPTAGDIAGVMNAAKQLLGLVKEVKAK